MERRALPERFLCLASLLALSVALLAYGYIGFYARYISDDFCTAAILRSEGFLGAQWYWYVHWSGRVSFAFLISAVELIGPTIVPFLPSLLLITWLLVMAWAISQIGAVGRLTHSWVVFLVLAELILFATLDGAPDAHQILYWQTGIITYPLSLVLFTAYVGLVSHKLARRSGGSILLPSVLSGVLTFIAGGLSETYVAFQTGVLFVAAALCVTGSAESLRKAVRPLVLAGLFGSVISAIVMVLAPGNAIRQLSYASRPDLLTLIPLSFNSSFSDALGFLTFYFLQTPVVLAGSVILPALIAFTLYRKQFEPISYLTSPANLAKLLLLLPIAGFILTVFCFAPAEYAALGPPPGRALLIPRFVLVWLTVCWGYLAGLALAQTLPSSRIIRSLPVNVLGLIVVIAVLTLGPISSGYRTLSRIPAVSAFASTWDITDQKIQAAQREGIRNLTVPTVHNLAGLEEMGTDQWFWANWCVANYYGLDTIIGE